MLMQLSASISQCSLSLILFPMLNFESFHLTFLLQKKVEKGDQERYLKSWLKILDQNLYSKNWRTEKNKTSIYSSQNVFETSWSSDHIIFFSPSPVNIILRNICHPWNFWEMFFKSKSATASVWMKVLISSAWSSGIIAFTFDSRNLQIRLPCPSVLLSKCAPHTGDLTRPDVVLSQEYLLPSVWVHPVFLV